MKRGITALSLLLAIAGTTGARINTVIVIPFSHQDIGFTATQDEVRRKYVDNYTELIGILERFPHFTFTVEAFWQYQQWLAGDPPPELQQFYLDMAREGRVEFTAAFGSMHTGFMNATTLREAFGDARRFGRKHGLEIAVAMMNDVPGFSQDLPDIMAEAGIQYFIAGVNAGFRQSYPMPDSEGLYYWEGPDGGRVLTWVPQMDYMQGVVYRSTSEIEEFVRRMEANGYPYDVIPILAAHDNRGFRPGFQTYINLVKDQIFLSGIEVVAGTPSDFFEAVEARYADVIPTKRGDWSGWWELTKVGGPYSAGVARRAQVLMENMVQWNLLDPEDDQVHRIRDNLLTYLEHSNHGTAGWPGFLTVEQLNTSNRAVVEYAHNAYEGLTDLLDRAMRRRRGVFFFRQDLVFNPLPTETVRTIRFTRPDWSADVTRSVRMNGHEYEALPFAHATGDAWRSIRRGWEFTAPVAPGFTRFTVGARRAYQPVVATGRRVLENGYYRVEFGPDGSVTSVYDKELDRSVGARGFGTVARNPHTGWEYHTAMTPVPTGEVSFRVVSDARGTTMRIEYGEGAVRRAQWTLPADEKALRLDLEIDRNRFGYTPYNEHSSDYYIRFPLPSESTTGGDGRFIYHGPASIVRDYHEFTQVRPFLIAARDLVGVERDTHTVTFASHHAFMVNWDATERYVIYQLAKDFSQAATKDRGVVDIDVVEPGTPEVIPFSFRFSSGSELDSEGVERYMNPTVTWSPR